MTTPGRGRLRLLILAVAMAVLVVLLWHRKAGDHGSTRGTSDDSAAEPDRRGGAAAARVPLRFRRGDVRLTLRGQVVDAAGKPVEGARVRLAGRASATTESDAQGGFEFESLFSGSYFLDAWTGDAATAPKHVHLRPDTGLVVLRLHGAASLRVTVLRLEDERPIPGAHIDILPPVHLGNEPIRSGDCDEHGRVTLRGLSPGSYGLVATADGFRTVETPLQPQAGLDWQETIKMVAGAPAEGRVVDPEGKPIEGAVIESRPASMVSAYSPRPRPARHQVRSGADGRFTIPALDEGQFVLRATHPRFQPGESKEVDSDGRSPRSGIEIVLKPGGRIAGQVVDAEGLAEPFARVRINTADPGEPGAGLRTAVCGPDGKFDVAGLPLLPVELVAASDDASSTNVAFDLSERPEYDHVRIELEFADRVDGVVTDPDGTPIEDAEVVCVGHKIGAIGTRPVVSETTDADGHFACTGLVPGEYALTARRPYANNNQSPWMRSAGVTATTGEEPVTIVLPLDGAITGKVELSDGTVATDFEVAVDESGAPRRFQSPDGRFTLDGLSPRQYELVVSIGTRSTEVDVAVPEGGVADVGTVEVSAY